MLYVFLAEGFEETEAVATIDVLRRAQLPVLVAGVGGKSITGAHGITIACDATVQDLTPGEDLQAVILPGGMPGTRNLEQDETVQQFITYAADHARLLCAICAAPSILGHRGLLQGKRATCYPGFEEALQGATLSTSPCCRDGNIITANGAGSALAFGLAIAAQFIGKDAAKSIEESMLCHTIQTTFG